MRSIRQRVLLLVLGLLTTTLTLISYNGYTDAQHEVEEVFDAELVQTARLLAGLVSRDMGDEAMSALQTALSEAVNQQIEGDTPSTSHEYEGKLGFLVMDREGHTLLHSAGAPVSQFESLPLPELRNAAHSAYYKGDPSQRLLGVSTGFHNVTLLEHDWRLFLLHDAADERWILVGERSDVRGELATNIALRGLVPDLFGLPLVALMVWLAVGWGLRPLGAMVQMLKSRQPDSLQPLTLAPLPAELEPMVASLNRLLMQVNELLARERRFLAFAAHELRTPLAVLKIQAHNASQSPDGADRELALQQLGSSVARATRVVEQLLTLARLEPGAAELSLETVDVSALIRTELAELTPLALQNQQDLTFESETLHDLSLQADPHALAILLQNLVSNAMAHTPSEGKIQVSLEAINSQVKLCVDDSGPGIPDELHRRVFEPFFREGPAQGAGLGLSIVARVAQLHQAQIQLHRSPLGGLQVCVVFPRSDKETPTGEPAPQ